jgi:hypothetical protein
MIVSLRDFRSAGVREGSAAPGLRKEGCLVSRKSPKSRATRGNDGNPSVRRAKDPSKYNSIEELRRELEMSKDMAPLSLTRAIQWVGDSINNGGASLAFRAYSWVLGLDQPLSWTRKGESTEDEMQALGAVERRLTENGVDISKLEVILLLPRQSVLKLVRRCPPLENANTGDLMTRMMDLKVLFPQNDVARMVELVPSGFLSQDWSETKTRLEESSSILREGLKGADVDQIFEEDPTILFEAPESLRHGLSRMEELWGIDEDILKNSFPDELALAVRALGERGAPSSINKIGSE